MLEKLLCESSRVFFLKFIEEVLREFRKIFIQKPLRESIQKFLSEVSSAVSVFGTFFFRISPAIRFEVPPGIAVTGEPMEPMVNLFVIYFHPPTTPS